MEDNNNNVIIIQVSAAMATECNNTFSHTTRKHMCLLWLNHLQSLVLIYSLRYAAELLKELLLLEKRRKNREVRCRSYRGFSKIVV